MATMFSEMRAIFLGLALLGAASARSAPLDIAGGGTNTSTQTTNGVAYFDGTKITTGTALVWDGTKLGVGGAAASGQYLDVKVGSSAGVNSVRAYGYQASFEVIEPSEHVQFLFRR